MTDTPDLTADDMDRLKSLPTYRFIPEHQALQLKEAETSVYRWWYEYLRLSEDYWFLCHLSRKRSPQTKCEEFAKIYHDFGDVFRLGFSHWWKFHGRRLFREQREPAKIKVLDPLHPVVQNSGGHWGNLVIQIPLSLSKRQIMRQIGKELVKRQDQRPRNILEASTARYPVNPVRYQINTLQTTHEVYCLHRELVVRSVYENKRRIDQGLKPIELNVDQFRIGKILHLNRGAEKLDGDVDEIARRKNVMRATVSRYIARAQLLIANVERGRFPDFSRVESVTPRFTDDQLAQRDQLRSQWLHRSLFSKLSYEGVERLVQQDGLPNLARIRWRYS